MKSHLRCLPCPTTLLLAVLFALVACTASAWSDAYDPPAGYYSAANGTGTALRSQLHDIIDAHNVVSYNSARSALQITDQDPNDSDRIVLVYDRVSLDVSGLMGSGIPGWDSGVSWNREHTWPRSRGVESSGPDNSDLHQLRPATPSVNSNRSNLNFGGAFGQPYGRVTDGGATVWYPGDGDAGMVARQQFYMDVRYDGSDSSTQDLELLAGDPASSGPHLGDVTRLLEWHYATPPDAFERRRNHVIYTDYQQNRNPFVDRPELVWSVFGDQQNDSQIVIAGQTPDSTGVTTTTVDLGSVLVGAPGTYIQTVSLNKNGNDGTYFQITTSANTTSTVSKSAFRHGGSDNTSFDAELTADTSTPGSQSGLVTIDNLDITTQGGPGRGAQDGDDEIQLTLDVLAHANPSFAAGPQVTGLTLDFGTLAAGATSPVLDFDIFNQVDVPGFTAGLELDLITPAGDTSAFLTDLTPFGGLDALEAGPAGRRFLAVMDTSQTGSYLANYTLSFSDVNLPGASSLDHLVLTLSGTITATLTLDFNADGSVDVVDLDMLTATGPIADGVSAVGNEMFDLNGDGTINLADRDQWLDQAATNNGLSSAYLLGDANLDGVVDGNDFLDWNNHKFTETLLWSNGNFTGDAIVDGSDFISWNNHKFQASDIVGVPEPAAGALAGLIGVWLVRRRRK